MLILSPNDASVYRMKYRPMPGGPDHDRLASIRRSDPLVSSHARFSFVPTLEIHPMQLPMSVRAAFVALLLLSTFSVASALQPDDAYDRIDRDMEQIRQLELLQPINLTTKTRAELQSETSRDLETDYPAIDRQNDQRVLVAFGLLSPDQDIGDIYVELLGEQIAGYYDPETDEMVVVSDDDADAELSASSEVTYAHEVVHALQDQHFDLESFGDQRIDGSDDESLAITALIEGDATSAQIEYLIANPGLIDDLSGEIAGADGGEALDDAPPIVRSTLLFPYDQGQAFVEQVMADGGWDAVDAAFASPPVSTEQILHPQKYLEGEAPVAVVVPDVAENLGDGWSAFDTNTMGEFQISVLLNGDDVSSRQAKQAAAGWSGDSYTVAGTSDQNVIVWNSEWDTGQDAAEFAETLAVRESGRLESTAEVDGDTTMIASDSTVVRIVIDGTSVSYISAPDQSVLEKVDGSPAAATPAS